MGWSPGILFRNTFFGGCGVKRLDIYQFRYDGVTCGINFDGAYGFRFRLFIFSRPIIKVFSGKPVGGEVGKAEDEDIPGQSDDDLHDQVDDGAADREFDEQPGGCQYQEDEDVEGHGWFNMGEIGESLIEV